MLASLPHICHSVKLTLNATPTNGHLKLFPYLPTDLHNERHFSQHSTVQRPRWNRVLEIDVELLCSNPRKRQQDLFEVITAFRVRGSQSLDAQLYSQVGKIVQRCEQGAEVSPLGRNGRRIQAALPVAEVHGEVDGEPEAVERAECRTR